MTTTDTAILIPARYDSKRFPGKPLCDLGGITMIQRIVDTCKKTKLPVYVLTDDVRISNTVTGCDLTIVSDKNFANGTERCAHAITMMSHKYKNFINVQGDMPDITVEIIEKIRKLLNDYEVSTVCTLMSEEEQSNPNSVKLVRGAGKCLWFGRGMSGYGDWHLGVYGYCREALQSYMNMTSTREERIEKLEQLRWLKNGVQIGVIGVEWNGIEINTPEDADKWNGVNDA